MENISIRADLSITRFFHVEAGIEATRLALLLQPGPDPLAIAGYQIKVPAAKHLDTQNAVHRHAFADFLLLERQGSGLPGFSGQARCGSWPASGNADNDSFLDPDLCPLQVFHRYEPSFRFRARTQPRRVIRSRCRKQ